MAKIETLWASSWALVRRHPFWTAFAIAGGAAIKIALSWAGAGDVVEQYTPWTLPALDELVGSFHMALTRIFSWWGWLVIVLAGLVTAMTVAFLLLLNNRKRLRENDARIEAVDLVLTETRRRLDAVALFASQQAEHQIRDELASLISEEQNFYDAQNGEVVIRTQMISADRLSKIFKRLSALESDS